MKGYKDGGYTTVKFPPSSCQHTLLTQKLKVDPNPGLKGKAIYTCHGPNKLNSRECNRLEMLHECSVSRLPHGATGETTS